MVDVDDELCVSVSASLVAWFLVGSACLFPTIPTCWLLVVAVASRVASRVGENEASWSELVVLAMGSNSNEYRFQLLDVCQLPKLLLNGRKALAGNNEMGCATFLAVQKTVYGMGASRTAGSDFEPHPRRQEQESVCEAPVLAMFPAAKCNANLL